MTPTTEAIGRRRSTLQLRGTAIATVSEEDFSTGGPSYDYSLSRRRNARDSPDLRPSGSQSIRPGPRKPPCSVAVQRDRSAGIGTKCYEATPTPKYWRGMVASADLGLWPNVDGLLLPTSRTMAAAL